MTYNLVLLTLLEQALTIFDFRTKETWLPQTECLKVLVYGNNSETPTQFGKSLFELYCEVKNVWKSRLQEPALWVVQYNKDLILNLNVWIPADCRAFCQSSLHADRSDFGHEFSDILSVFNLRVVVDDSPKIESFLLIPEIYRRFSSFFSCNQN